MADCGAKTRSGTPCKKRAMANGRCLNHGGKCAETHAKNKNAVKAGSIYSKYLTDEENTFVDEVETGDLTHEIKLAKLQVLRIQREMNSTNGGVELELSSAQVVERGGEKTTTMQKQRRDFHGMLDRALARVASLELAQKARLDGIAGGDSDVMPTSFVFEVSAPVGDVRITRGSDKNDT